MSQIARYRLDEVQGFGAFATVWRGWDPELDVPVAIKVLAENWSNHADVRDRFLSEARLLRRIDHPRVIRVHDVGLHEGRPYFVMDFIEGGTLADRIAAHPTTAAALDLAAQSAHAVQALHDAGVLHRDVKPSNLLVRADPSGDHVLVTDLGSAKQLADASGITVTTGTPAYMAPEQARGRPIDARADVYSLGALTYELLSGRPPFRTGDLHDLLERTPTTRPAEVAGAVGLPSSIDLVLSSALAFTPDDRPASAASLAEALGHVGAGQKVRGFRRARRDLSLGLVLAGAAVVFVAAMGVVLFLT